MIYVIFKVNYNYSRLNYDLVLPVKDRPEAVQKIVFRRAAGNLCRGLGIYASLKEIALLAGSVSSPQRPAFKR